MIHLTGYQILSQIYESSNSEVYRGVRQIDGQNVILKVLKQDYPTPEELTRYKQEYELTRSLDIEGVIRAYSLEKYQKTLVIVLEDFGATSLKQWLEEHPFNLNKNLEILIKICVILGELHAQNIIHKDINSANIVIHPQTQQVKIIDLGISSRINRENPTLKTPSGLEGTLAYISPEQTGRMNRSLDYRTDFYSLGVMAYELLTHQLPFETNDDLEMVHCHIARQPVPPDQINHSIPPILAEIVMKLMAKNAEDRYQSAWGLKVDLEKCLEQWQSMGTIEPFILGSEDISDRFQIPQKLYGREKEIQILITAFDRVQNQSEIMLVTGYSGIGKSCLVQEIYKPITEKRGYFIAGKFDQFQRNFPYSAMVNALQKLVQQILTESQDFIELWKEKVLRALGINGQVIIEVIPEIELIIGSQPPVPDLGATEAQNRFNLVFQNFIRACCAPDHPLVIFLDDLQWADGATLRLIKLMMSDVKMKYLFLIGAYRDNEVDLGHPLTMMLNELRETTAIINEIHLTNLGISDLRQLMSDTLKRNREDLEDLEDLANLVLEKTDGNPFFVNQFLLSLYSDNMINFDYGDRHWCWDQKHIESRNITDNVVELMLGKLRKLPEPTQEILQLAACIGAQFSLQTLSIIDERSPSEIFPNLITAIQSGLVLSLSPLNEELLIQDYQFLHDRVQQAAYTLIPEHQKPALHLKIGRLLLKNCSSVEREEKIFDLVSHLNLGQSLIENSAEKKALAQLNLEAGEKAQKSTAYAAGLLYLKAGIELVGAQGWQSDYALTLNLHSVATEVAYLNADLEEMEQIAAQVLHNARTILDQTQVYEVLINAQTSQGKMLEGINLGRRALQGLGVEFPETINRSESDAALVALNHQLAGRKIETLIDLPLMTDPSTQAAMRVLGMLLAPVFQGQPELLPILGITMVRLSLEFGNTPSSVVGYVLHGLVLCAVWQELQTGYEFGRLALDLLERCHWISFKAIVHNMFGAHIQHFRDPIRATLKTLHEGHDAGMETGDFLFAGYNICNSYLHRVMIGIELENTISELVAYRALMTQIKQFSPLVYLEVLQQTVTNLRETVEAPHLLQGDIYDERVKMPKQKQDKELTSLALLYLYKLYLAYLFGNYEAGLDYIAIVQAESYENAVTAMIFSPFFYFYATLTYLAVLSPDSPPEQFTRMEEYRYQVYQWSQNSPKNHHHKWDLVEAERYRVLGNRAEAIEHYERAIARARETQYINEEGLANELAAQFYLSWGKEKLAQLHIQEAEYAYTYWGALSKVRHLKQQYPQFFDSSLSIVGLKGTRVTRSSISSTGSGSTLDFVSVIRANQAISGEIVLEKLLRELMKIILQNAGAQRGYLILVEDQNLMVEALGNIDSEEIEVLQQIPIDELNDLCHAVINYVARTQESVVLQDATTQGNFTQDPYIKSNGTKSILCVPLVNQGKLVSLVYLENNLTTGAFTANRVEMMQLLSGQAAIALENAYLYQTLEKKVAKRTAQLALANQEIKSLNEKLKAENIRLSSELDVAKKIQQMVLPKITELEAIADLEIAGYMEPADEVGGDYYDVLTDGNQVKIGIGDVTGHGLESGVLMLMAQTVIRTLQNLKYNNSVEFLDIVNKTLYQNLQRMNCDKNMSLAILDYQDRAIRLSGQHEEMIVVRADGKLERIDTLDLGFPIGLDKEIAQFIREQSILLNPEDIVILYTDGITEAANPANEQYGIERLAQLAVEHRHCSAAEIRAEIISNVRNFIGTQKVFDDITLVVLKQK